MNDLNDFNSRFVMIYNENAANTNNNLLSKSKSVAFYFKLHSIKSQFCGSVGAAFIRVWFLRKSNFDGFFWFVNPHTSLNKIVDSENERKFIDNF